MELINTLRRIRNHEISASMAGLEYYEDSDIKAAITELEKEPNIYAIAYAAGKNDAMEKIAQVHFIRQESDDGMAWAVKVAGKVYEIPEHIAKEVV